MPVKAAPEARVTGVSARSYPDRVEIFISSSAPVRHTAGSVSKPQETIVLEVFPAELDPSAARFVDVKKGVVESIRLVQSGAETVKVQVNLTSQASYAVSPAADGNGLLMVVSMGSSAASSKATGVGDSSMLKMARDALLSEEEAGPAETGSATLKGKQVIKASPPTRKASSWTSSKTEKAAPKSQAKASQPKPILVNMEFKDAEVLSVIRLLAKQSGENMVCDPSVKGTITMALKDVPFETALMLIVKTSGLEYTRLGNIIVVGSADSLKRLPDKLPTKEEKGAKLTQVIPLEQAKVSDVITTLTARFPGAEIMPDARINALIVTADSTTIKGIKRLVSQIDVQAPTASARSELIRLKYTSSDKAKTQLEAVIPEIAGKIQTDDRLNALMVTASEDLVKKVKDTIDSFDIPLQQVMLEIKVMEISGSGLAQLGVQWDYAASTKLYENRAIGSSAQTDTVQDLAIGYFTRSPLGNDQGYIRATLNYLVQTKDAKILATPRVAVISGKEANVHVGDKYPIVYFDPRAGQNQVIYVDIGVELKVKPTIGPDGYITTEIAPKVSDQTGMVDKYPITSERTASTTLRVKNGETIILGGLLKSTGNKTVSKVPLLGDIPILGELFKFTNNNTAQTELVIMITPRIIVQ
ncbi:MAG: secretin N-terminal domain-containing protein [bacterium]